MTDKTISACKEGHKKDCDMFSNIGIPSAQKDESYCTCGKSNPPTETDRVITSKDSLGKDELYCEWYKCPFCRDENVVIYSSYCSNCGSSLEWKLDDK